MNISNCVDVPALLVNCLYRQWGHSFIKIHVLLRSLFSRQAIRQVRTRLPEIDYSFIEMMSHVILRGHWKAR